MKTYFLLPILFISLSSSLVAQVALQKDKEISVYIGAAATMIENYNINHDKNLTIDDKIGADFNIEYSKYFLDRVGVGVGLGFSNYDQVYYQKGLFIQTDQVDIDGRVYDKWINSDIKYTNKLMYATVPVTLHFLLGSSSRCYGFIDAGIINQFLIKGTHTEKGTIETMGKYPSETGNPNWFGITAHNDYYGVGPVQVSEKDTKKYNPYNLSGHFAVGLAAEMARGLYLKIQPFVNVGFTDIRKKDGKDYENVFGEKSTYKATRLFSTGISVGVSLDI